jgi:hypothetical protein
MIPFGSMQPGAKLVGKADVLGQQPRSFQSVSGGPMVDERLAFGRARLEPITDSRNEKILESEMSRLVKAHGWDEVTKVEIDRTTYYVLETPKGEVLAEVVFDGLTGGSYIFHMKIPVIGKETGQRVRIIDTNAER